MINKLKEDLKVAMKNKNVVNKFALQLLINSFNNFMKDNKLTSLTKEQEVTLIQRELKQTNESLEFAKKSGRQDLINDTQAKIALLLAYLPKQMSEDEIKEVINESLKELNIETPVKTDKGRIMKVIMPKLKGKADGKTIDSILTTMLA